MDQFRKRPSGTGRRIYDLLRAQIADGTLPTDAPVPSTRALAADLGVSRTTVTAVYEQLAAEGFLVTSAGRAARVAIPAKRLPANHPRRHARTAPALSQYGNRVADIPMPQRPPASEACIDFLYGAVAARDFPALAWKRAYHAELSNPQDILYYVASEGDPSLRRALQAYLARARGLACDAEQIVIVNGTQQAIDLCARLLLDPGDAFICEDPGYLIARQCFEAAGAKPIPVAVDEHGLATHALPENARARLAYDVTPSHQFPLGGVLPIGRRLELLEWAQRNNAWIIEDDYDGEFRYGQRPIDALQSIDTNGRVIYIGTFSKALSPHLRLGYLVLPHSLVPVFRQAKRLSDRHAPVLDQRVLATLIESGAYERHVRRVRREYERRRAALLDAIAHALPAGTHVTGTAAGLHIVVWLPLSATKEAEWVEAARAAKVGVYPVSPFYAASDMKETTRNAGFILGYASVSVAQIREGINRLGLVIARF